MFGKFVCCLSVIFLLVIANSHISSADDPNLSTEKLTSIPPGTNLGAGNTEKGLQANGGQINTVGDLLCHECVEYNNGWGWDEGCKNKSQWKTINCKDDWWPKNKPHNVTVKSFQCIIKSEIRLQNYIMRRTCHAILNGHEEGEEEHRDFYRIPSGSCRTLSYSKICTCNRRLCNVDEVEAKKSRPIDDGDNGLTCYNCTGKQCDNFGQWKIDFCSDWMQSQPPNIKDNIKSFQCVKKIEYPDRNSEVDQERGCYPVGDHSELKQKYPQLSPGCHKSVKDRSKIRTFACAGEDLCNDGNQRCRIDSSASHLKIPAFTFLLALVHFFS